MKAKEYLEKYGDAVYKDALEGKHDAALDMFKAFVLETKDILEQRHAVTDRACLSVFREQDQKWNALARLFAQKYGQEVLVPHAVINYYRKEIPEVALEEERWERSKSRAGL